MGISHTFFPSDLVAVSLGSTHSVRPLNSARPTAVLIRHFSMFPRTRGRLRFLHTSWAIRWGPHTRTRACGTETTPRSTVAVRQRAFPLKVVAVGLQFQLTVEPS